MANYLITGGSRGLGLELVRQLLALPATQVGKVFALARGESSALRDVVDAAPGRGYYVTAAVDDLASLQRAAEVVGVAVRGAGLDMVVNNAGVGLMSPEGQFRNLADAAFLQALDVNVVGPHRVIATLLPLLQAGKQKKIINISSGFGSVALAREGASVPVHGYKVSKSGLNMLNAQYAVDLAGEGFTVLAISPGWLKTDMGGNDMAELPVDVGAAAVAKIIAEATPAMNGKFVNIDIPGKDHYDGKEIPW